MDKKVRDKKTIFLTGASGNMGYETFKLLYTSGKYNLRLLVLPDKAGKQKFGSFYPENRPKIPSDIHIFWGDLTRYEDVQEAMGEPDIVLHVGAMIPPAADHHPDLARTINYGGTQHVIRAIQALENPHAVKLVFIGTVAEMGNRLPPVHWERVGDPIMISRHDAYAESKVMAERAVIESGLEHWVSLRQTAMLYPNLFDKLDPIIYHQPLNTHMEWVTVYDSARALFNICEKTSEDTLDESFWKQVYNIGGGKDFRKTNIEFMEAAFGMLGISDMRKVVNPNWFATENFHGCWFLDSDRLENILHYRRDSFEGFLREVESNLPVKKRIRRFITRFIPSWMVKYFVMLPVAKAKHGTIYSLKKQMEELIISFWGSLPTWLNLPKKWEHTIIDKNPDAQRILHGYNEKKPVSQLNLDDMRQAADFRGGSCLSEQMEPGNISEPLQWECSSGHQFSASPRLILHTGHWCPYCDIDSVRYPELGAENKFLHQVTRGSVKDRKKPGRKLVLP